MIRERILFRLFFSLLLLLSFSPFCTYEPTSQIHPKEMGWKVLIVWECELKKNVRQERLEKIVEEIREE